MTIENSIIVNLAVKNANLKESSVNKETDGPFLMKTDEIGPKNYTDCKVKGRLFKCMNSKNIPFEREKIVEIAVEKSGGTDIHSTKVTIWRGRDMNTRVTGVKNQD